MVPIFFFLLDPLNVQESAPPYALWGIITLLLTAVSVIAWSLLKSSLKKTDMRCDGLHTKIVEAQSTFELRHDALQREFNDYRLKHVETSSASEIAQTKRLAEMEASIISAIHNLGERTSQEFATKAELRETKEELKLSIEKVGQH